MSETRDYLDHHAKRTADNIVGTIESIEPDGTYRYRSIGEQAVRFASPATSDTYNIGERVIVSRPSATRNVLGSMDSIVSRAPREQRGLSATTPNVTRNFADRVTLQQVDPDPLVLVTGGESAEQTFTGSGLLELPTYYAPVEGGTDPTLEVLDSIVDESGARVWVSMSAGGLSAIGDFDAEISGARAPKTLRVVKADPDVVLYVPGARVYGVWPEMGTLIKQSDLLPHTAVRAFGVPSEGLIVAFYAGGGAAVLPRSLRVIADYASPAFPLPNATTQLVEDQHGFIWYGAAAGLVKVSMSTGAATVIHNNGGTYEGVAYDAVLDVVFACEQSTQNVRKFNRATGATLSTTAMPNVVGTTYPRNLQMLGAQLVVMAHPFTDSGSVVMLKFDAAAMTLDDTSSTGTNAYPIGLTALIGNDGITNPSPLWITRRTDTGTGGYDASNKSYLVGFVANMVYGPVAQLSNIDVMSAGLLDDRTLAIVGRNSAATRLYIVLYRQVITGGGPAAGQLSTAGLITCEASIPATPMPSAFLAR